MCVALRVTERHDNNRWCAVCELELTVAAAACLPVDC